MTAVKEFIRGFFIAISIAAVSSVILALLIFGFESPKDLKEAVFFGLILTSFVLVYGGGEIAVSILFAWDTPMGIKFLSFLGALTAVIGAFIFTPIILDALEAPEEECRLIAEAKIGPVKISREECDD